MADITPDVGSWSSTAGSNQPGGTTAIGTGLDDNLRAIQAGVKAALENLSSVAGTNTITATCANLTAYATGQVFRFIPANTNTGATTIAISSLTAKNIFWNGAACVGGEIRQSIPVTVIYDGTQFHIIANGFAAPFLDTYPIVEGSSDSTKKVRIEADGLTTATTRVITMPDADVTLGLGAAAGVAQSFLGSDTALNNTGTYFNVVNTGSIGASGQVWLLIGTACVEDTAGAARINVRIWDATTTFVETTHSGPAAGIPSVVTVMAIVTPSAAATYHLSCKDVTSTSGQVRTTSSAGTANKATSITAIRLV